MEKAKIFLKDAEEIAFNDDHRQKIAFNISRYDENVVKGKEQFANLDIAREKAANVKHKILNDLEKYLIEFEANFEKQGGKVIWAPSAKDAIREILAILKKHEVGLVLKSKSIISEELETNHHLEKAGIEVLETDLGEYIVQLAGEKPYHILTPAMHKSKEDVAKLFHEKFGLPEESAPEEITAFVRHHLRTMFMKAGAGITGANFLVADSGAVCLTENEGNAVMSFSFPKLHIVIAGIEKLIPSLADLHLFWPLLATHGTGQKMTVYNSIVFGPRHNGENDGPDEMYVILLDNGRTSLLKQVKQRRALSCIRCGACLNACPVYRSIGGYTYGSVYTGPIGSVITPFTNNFSSYKHLSYASSLCGNCTEVCPVKIPLHQYLLDNRHEAVVRNETRVSEKLTMTIARETLLRRGLLEMTGGKTRGRAMKKLMGKAWGSRRKWPEFAEKSFNRLWREEAEKKKDEGMNV
jgi:L-lactate dehydrogenase complex protein LldF